MLSNILGLSKTTVKFSIFEQYFDDFLNTLNAKKIVLNNIVDSLKILVEKTLAPSKNNRIKFSVVSIFSNMLYVDLET